MNLINFRNIGFTVCDIFHICSRFWLALSLFINDVWCSDGKKESTINFFTNDLIDLENTISTGYGNLRGILQEIECCKRLFTFREDLLMSDSKLSENIKEFKQLHDHMIEKLKLDIEIGGKILDSITERINEITKENQNKLQNENSDKFLDENSTILFQIKPRKKPGRPIFCSNHNS